jgi:hypothetical protein
MPPLAFLAYAAKRFANWFQLRATYATSRGAAACHIDRPSRKQKVEALRSVTHGKGATYAAPSLTS